MIAILLTALTFFSTLAGGLFALRFRDQLHLLLAFSAGVLVTVTFADVLPEALRTAGRAGVPVTTVLLVVLIGFFLFHFLEKGIVLHARRGEDREDEEEHVGVLGAGGFSFHSFLDGLAIGIGYQAGTDVGLLIALAVIAHDFSDGFNTVTVLLRYHGSRRTAFLWLIVDALAPLLGAFSTLFIQIPEFWLALILAEFAGSFLYIGASDLLPEAYHRHASVFTMLCTLAGAVVIYAVQQIVSV